MPRFPLELYGDMPYNTGKAWNQGDGMKTNVAGKPKAQIDARAGKSGTMTRIDARISRKLKDKIEQAAHLREQTLTNFLAVALDEIASRVIMEEAALRLHIDDQRRLAEVLIADKPFPPVGAMSRLRRYASDYAEAVERK
jgi:uncharacterized protein (DUF1778 family)